jgi:hypothetical protein
MLGGGGAGPSGCIAIYEGYVAFMLGRGQQVVLYSMKAGLFVQPQIPLN